MSIKPDPNRIFPIANLDGLIHIKPTLTQPNIIVGDFSYFSGTNFAEHVTHHYEFYGDKLIIGKFCQIAKGVNFIMNGANHQMNAVSTFPFYIFEGWQQPVPALDKLPFKGDTVVENDVWIGQNVTILPGVHIGNGAIIGANSTVGSEVEPYSIVAGNPAKLIRKRFDDELIALMQQLCWWDLPIDQINGLVPLLSNNNLEEVKLQLKQRLNSSVV